MSGAVPPSALKAISNRIRRKTIQLLSEQRMTYLDMLLSCGLDPDRHCGWFNYHLGVLLDEGVVTKDGYEYLLTDFGTGIARLLAMIDGESERLFGKELRKLDEGKVQTVQSSLKIEIEEIPNGTLTITLDHRHPFWCQGERRIYREAPGFPPEIETPWGRGNYSVDTCLERIWFPKKEQYRYVMLYEVYTSKYDGTEENRSTVQRTEEGYYLDNWAKVEEVQKREGLYQMRRESWCVRGPTKPEEEILDLPEEIVGLPSTLKIGDRLRKEDKIIQDGEELGRTVSDERILGEYRVNIGGGEHACLLARSTLTYELKNGSSWKHIVDMFKGKDGVLVLKRRYSSGRWLERHGYVNWEKGLSLECEGVTYYLEPSETYYLAERYIPTINLGKIEN